MHFPAHECYCEPYSGSLAVLLRKGRSPLEVANDLDRETINFFRVLREQPDELIRLINLTPYAKAEWELSFELSGEPLEDARRFYARSYMSIAGPTAQWKTGWRRQKVISRGVQGDKKMTPASITFMQTDHLYQVAERLRGVQIECDDALAIMKRYDSPVTLHYVDPPYVPATRGRWSEHAYAHEMDDADHRQLAAVLHGLSGMVVLSGYRCAMYDELFVDWKRIDKRSRINGPGDALESLWLSPLTQERLSHEDLPIFRRR
jgi:DNA adenine methylase